jgi:hemolysin D
MTMRAFPLSLRQGDVWGTDERSFLPAALEILETPPSPLGRGTAYALCLLAFCALVWATVGKVDIVAVASGKIVSHLRTQVVQSFETATITAVLVTPGQYVHSGDALIELDKTATLAERERAERDLTAASLDQLRLTAFLGGAADASFESVATASPLEIRQSRAQLAAQVAGRSSQIADLQQEMLQRQAERQALQQTSAKIEETLPMVAERANIRTKAADVGNASILAKLESQQLLVETRAELVINRSKIASLDAAIGGLDRKIATVDAEIRTTAMADLSKAEDRLHGAREALVKAERRVELQTLRAPIDGTVQQMQVASVGSVVAPAQQLLSIAANDERMEVEAVVENRDVGFIAAGQPVEIKIDAFPFTRYGLIGGAVLSVDHDAEATPVGQNALLGAQRPADQIDNVELSERLRYTVHISLRSRSLNVDGHSATLLPGMSVRAEILTGKRRIIDFLVAPLRELTHDALRER